jgi:hypothetical protein
MRKMHLDTSVDEVAKVSPVSKVARATINLVNNYAIGPSADELLHHAGEHSPTTLCSRLQFFEPFNNRKIVLLCVFLDG